MRAGIYTVQDIMNELGFSMDGITDYRRVKVGGLGFDYLDKQINIPGSAATIVITLDGKEAATAPVEPEDAEPAPTPSKSK